MNDTLFGPKAPLGVLKDLLISTSEICFLDGFSTVEELKSNSDRQFICSGHALYNEESENFSKWVSLQEGLGRMVVIRSRLGTGHLQILPGIDVNGRPDPFILESALFKLASAFRCPVHLFDSGASYHIYLETIFSDDTQSRGEESALASFLAKAQMITTFSGQSVFDPPWLTHQITRNGVGGLRISKKYDRYPTFVKTIVPPILFEHETYDPMCTPEEMASWASSVLSPLGLCSVLTVGSSQQDTFRAGISDFDLFVVYDSKLSISVSELIHITQRMTAFGYDIFLVAKDELKNSMPEAYHVGTFTWRKLLPIEIINVQRYSDVLFGEDVRSVLPPVQLRDAALDSIVHRINSYTNIPYWSTEVAEEYLDLIYSYCCSFLRDMVIFISDKTMSKRDAVLWIQGLPSSTSGVAKVQQLLSAARDEDTYFLKRAPVMEEIVHATLRAIKEQIEDESKASAAIASIDKFFASRHQQKGALQV